MTDYDREVILRGSFAPEFLLLSDKPRWIIYKLPWKAKQKFYEIRDLKTNKLYYRTSLEARIFVGASRNSFYRFMVKRTDGLFKDRYVVKRIPKFLFIKKTGRTMQEFRKYPASVDLNKEEE